MSAEGKFDHAKNRLCGWSVNMMITIIILSLVISYGGGADNLVEVTGNSDSLLVEESPGLHLLEINESGKCDTAGAG